MGNMIIVENLTKRYGKKTVVNDLSFTVPDGQVTGFLGPNGAGKSTTMRCMLGLDKPSAGKVTFSGRGYAGDFAGLDSKSSIAGAVLDATWFTPARSGRNHLRVIAKGAGISDKRVDECLDMVGLTSAGKKKVGGYSLGMKQRLGLAAALLGNPQHLILDEPVNGLDPEGVSWMRRTIRHLADDGRGLLVSSHLLSEMQQTADRLVLIGQGKLIGEQTLDEFLAGGAHVEVECKEAVLLADSLRSRGFQVDLDRERTLRVVVDNIPEHEVRAAIAATALEEKFAVTKLATTADNLEQRFLAATASQQEYRSN